MNTGHDCERMLETMSDYIDGSLRQSLCQELEKHLEGCQNCRVVVNTLKKTIELYHQPDETLSVPGDLRERLYARLDLADLIEQPREKQERACPHCGNKTLDYDSMLDLTCSTCGWRESGSQT